jgi:very-short-patch-repair endonuclease
LGHAALVLPSVLLEEFTAAQAKEVGVGVRQLARLRGAGLAVRTGTIHRLVEPAEPSALALAAVGQPAALCGVTAARHYGWLEEDPAEDVHLLVPRRRCPQPWPHTHIHRCASGPKDIVEVEGLRLTSPVRTALDVSGELDLVESLPMLDRLLREEVLDKEQLLEGLADRDKWPGSFPAALAVGLSDARHASHPESVFRALVHQDRLPAPIPQHPVRLNGIFVGRADFAWPRYRVLAEIDGYEFHKEYGVFLKDRQRQRKSLFAGWLPLHFAAAEVRDHPAEVIAEVRKALDFASAA